MKYFSNYNSYKNYVDINQTIINDNELYERNFFQWLIKSRKFGDLFSLKKVVKKSKRIAEIDYIYTKTVKQFQMENAQKGMATGSLTLDQADELKTYQEEKINLNKQIEHKHGDSEFLMYTAEAIKNEEELKYIKKRRKETKSGKEKSELKKLEKITQQQSGLLKQQVESSMPDASKNQEVVPTTGLSDVERHKFQIEKSKRDEILNKLQIQKTKLQVSEVSARTKQMKQFYSSTEGNSIYQPRSNSGGRKRPSNTEQQKPQSKSKPSF